MGKAVPVVLTRWRVKKVKSRQKAVDGRAFAYGYIEREDAGRVSHAIKTYDPATGLIMTGLQSFVLEGEPGSSRDAEHAWLKFVSANAVTDEQEVTARYLPKPGSKNGRAS